MGNTTPEGELFARRVAAFIEQCCAMSKRQLAEAATDDIAELKCSTVVLEHIAWRGPRGQ